MNREEAAVKGKWLTLWITLVFIVFFTTPGFALYIEYNPGGYSTPHGLGWYRFTENQNISIPDWQELYSTPSGLGSVADYQFLNRGITVETIPAAPVPEPTTLLLLGSGLICAGILRKKFRAK